MSNIIRLLPDHVANQIAAGEVVQRPASVVKELVENSVDAGATEIKLVLKEAGKTLIQVIDNGKGMSDTDARMAFERHATSKISSAEDLFALRTKGFRGEALASIAAIAHVELKTRAVDAELGTHIVIEGTKLVSQEVAVTPVGTSFSVKNLFFNIPARRNFLKSTNVEFRNIVDEFERIVLVHSDIHFVLIHNGNEVYNLPPANLRQRIVSVFGSRTNEKLVPIKEATEIVEISGFVGKPEFAKKSRGEQFFFVNDRFVKSGYLHHAVLAAYEGLLKEGTHPTYFIYLKVPTDSIDINIHPTKTEVKFDDEQALYSILRSTIKHSLGQFNVAPVLDFQRDSTFDTPYDYEGTEASTPTIEVDRNFNPFSRNEYGESDKFEYNPFENPFMQEESDSDSGVIESKMTALEDEEQQEYVDLDTGEIILESKEFASDTMTFGSKSNDEFSLHDDYNNHIDFEKSTTDTGYIASKGNDVNFAKSRSTAGTRKEDNRNAKGSGKEWNSFYEGLYSEGKDLDVSNLHFETEVVESTLFDKSKETSSTSRTFQINRKYIVSPIKSGLVVIDQGRAHQRILYEKFLSDITDHRAATQQLLFPLTLYYTPYEVAILKELQDLLKQTGFGFEEMGSDFVVISGLPVNVAESEASIVLEDLITDFNEGIPQTKFSQGDRIAKSLAHSLAVKTGTTLTEEEQENIVNTLFACKEPDVSPFRKPTFITMKVEDIEKKFSL
ncbi:MULTISPECIES: DNA mismatch repair endonuclease MutL [Myroides]|uniref:DNA mismatch repair protein MutL n=1 Tax=Myroides albus TaxID=2562892 RepID=A0A6I3LMT3_9FLAO|nr:MULTISPECIES: DNA mismatch repair endonuclease MutL [Myroides]MTG99027.1 DNA mismatch repair endonuclease MutL [Myroides albus]MVX34487.1 DNA mismatch repair endonuclease MutL [Myroides sp. LoEW2-1]UVD80436.1 DNA mismatch repair endonuclease MutL [Myroides albus]